jgi:hypothetical protein
MGYPWLMSLRNSFKRPTGIAGWFLLLWGVVGTWSRIEFLLGKARRLAPLMPVLLDVITSAWFRLALVVVGLLLIGISSWPKNRLALLRAGGQRLIDERITEAQFTEWWARVRRWQDAVLALLEYEFTEVDVREFNGPQEVYYTRDCPGPVVNDSHAMIRVSVRDQTERLDAIIARHKRTARLSLGKWAKRV